METPPIAYYDLEDRPGDSVESLREGELVENFESVGARDDMLTTATWNGDGLVRGSLGEQTPDPFGESTEDLILAPPIRRLTSPTISTTRSIPTS